jgi:glycosyltransferase involved in cell wall biosynthesis
VSDLERIVISTTDPRNRGGVWGVTAALVEGLEQLGWKDRIELIYPSLRIPAGELVTEQIDGIPSKAYRFRPTLGNTYASHFASKLLLGKRILQQGSINFAVGGGNQSALPFLMEGQPYSLWVSNTVDDEYEQIFKGRQNKHDLKGFIGYRLFRPATRIVEKTIFDKAQTVFVESNYSLKVISESYSIPQNRLTYLPYPMSCKTRSGSPPIMSGRYVLFAGRVDDPRKNVQMLVNAFSQLNDPSLKLVLAGTVDRDGPVQRLVNRLGIGDRTFLTGFVDDASLHNLLENARVFVMPSLQEGLCNAVVEALSHSLPVVATKCGGVQDSIANGENGFLVEINDVTAMAEKLRELCGDDNLRQELSVGAARHIRKMHSSERFTATLQKALPRQ